MVRISATAGPNGFCHQAANAGAATPVFPAALRRFPLFFECFRGDNQPGPRANCHSAFPRRVRRRHERRTMTPKIVPGRPCQDGRLGEFASRLCGSADIYGDRAEGRRPSASVNVVTVHDGFTLNDLVSYDQKHNWGETNWAVASEVTTTPTARTTKSHGSTGLRPTMRSASSPRTSSRCVAVTRCSADAVTSPGPPPRTCAGSRPRAPR